ncbi:hypothetical protein DFQ30_003857 [Apophysomyces sp. BC1015]|nr:hypothetical protein DFQ30_003857 [Apophysomyces sp. BC1015]KAG0178781.1 hypothetical protein DFQ29_003025 [Apophysomyces sp. BC1021]
METATLNKPATSLRFADSFWDENDHGVDILCDRLRHGKQTCEEIRKLYEIRAQIEEDYGERLLKLSQLAIGKSEEGSFAESLSHISSALETTARAHIDLAQQIQHHLESPLSAFLKEQRAQRKSHLQQIENSKQLKNLHLANVTRTKESYAGEAANIEQLEEQLRNDNITTEEKQKLQSQIQERKTILSFADQEHKRAVDVLDSVTTNWAHHWRSTCDAFQNMEEKRMDKLRRGLWAFANMMSSVYTVDDQCCDRIRTSLESADVKNDISAFVQRHRTVIARPEPRKYLTSRNAAPENGQVKNTSSFAPSLASSIDLKDHDSSQSMDRAMIKALPPHPPATNMTNPDEELKSVEQQLHRLEVNQSSPKINGHTEEYEPKQVPRENQSTPSPPDNISFAFKEVENMLKNGDKDTSPKSPEGQEAFFDESRMKALPEDINVTQATLPQEQECQIQVAQDKNEAPKMRSVSVGLPSKLEATDVLRPASVQLQKTSVTDSDKSFNELKFKPVPNPHYKTNRSSDALHIFTGAEQEHANLDDPDHSMRSSAPEMSAEAVEKKQDVVQTKQDVMEKKEDTVEKKEDTAEIKHGAETVKKVEEVLPSLPEIEIEHVITEAARDHKSENGGSELSYTTPSLPPKDEKWIISSTRRPQQVPVRAQNATVYDGQNMPNSRNATPRTSVIQDSHSATHVDAAAQLLNQTSKELETAYPAGKLQRPKVPLTIEIPNSSKRNSNHVSKRASREGISEEMPQNHRVSVPKDQSAPSRQQEQNNSHFRSVPQQQQRQQQQQPQPQPQPQPQHPQQPQQWNAYTGPDRHTMHAYPSNQSYGIRPAPWQEGRLSFDSDLAQQQVAAPATFLSTAPAGGHMPPQRTEQQGPGPSNGNRQRRQDEEIIPPSRILNQHLQSSAVFEPQDHQPELENSKGPKQGKDFSKFMKGVLKPSSDFPPRNDPATTHSKASHHKSSRLSEKPSKDKSSGRFSLGIFGKKEKRVKEPEFVVREQPPAVISNAPREPSLPAITVPTSPHLPQPSGQAAAVTAAAYQPQENRSQLSQSREQEPNPRQQKLQPQQQAQQEQSQHEQQPLANGQDNRAPDGPPILHYARAIWSFDATIPSELSFTAGDMMTIIRKQPDGWWVADLQKDPEHPVRGLVPGNYMQIMES